MRSLFHFPGISTPQPVESFGTYTMQLYLTDENAELATSGASPSKTTFVKPLQFRNAEGPILVTLSGIVTLVKPRLWNL